MDRRQISRDDRLGEALGQPPDWLYHLQITLLRNLFGHRAIDAVTAATLLGFGSAILFGQAHLLPPWGPVGSDSFINPAANAGVTTFSWVTAVLEIGTGLVLGTVAARARRP